MENKKVKTGYFKSHDGAKIYYEDRGEGPVIILTYGIGCLLNHWRYQVEHFSENYRVISYDLRGHHESQPPEDRESISIDAMGKDLLALADHLGVEEFSAWGHSFGCPVVLSAYEQRPEVMNSIVFINGFSYNPFDGKIPDEKLQRLNQRMNLYRKYIPNVVDFVWHKATSSPMTLPATILAGGFNPFLTPMEDIRTYVKGLQNLNAEVYGRSFHDMTQWDGRSIAKQIKVPTLVMAGERDRISPMERQMEFQKSIPGSDFISYPWGTHCTQLDMRKQVNADAEKFLKDKVNWQKSA